MWRIRLRNSSKKGPRRKCWKELRSGIWWWRKRLKSWLIHRGTKPHRFSWMTTVLRVSKECSVSRKSSKERRNWGKSSLSLRSCQRIFRKFLQWLDLTITSTHKKTSLGKPTNLEIWSTDASMSSKRLQLTLEDSPGKSKENRRNLRDYLNESYFRVCSVRSKPMWLSLQAQGLGGLPERWSHFVAIESLSIFLFEWDPWSIGF